MDKVTLAIIRDKLYNLSGRMYDCVINSVDASYELDYIIDEIDEELEFMEQEDEKKGVEVQ